MSFWERFGNMFLDALQTVFSTLWGLLWAALGGGIPALAAVASNQAKYGQSYWSDVAPVFIAGALFGLAGFVQQQKSVTIGKTKGILQGRAEAKAEADS